MFKLNLTKPIVVFDIESTGVDVATDRIVEICLYKVYPDGKEEVKTYKVNPGIPIPPQSTFFHGIKDEDVVDCPTFKELGQQIVNFIGNADLSGFNAIKFDIPILLEELLRAEIDFDMKGRRLIDVQNIFHKMERRNLKAAYKFYCGKKLENAHTAEADTRATFEILTAQVERYNNLEVEDDNGNLHIPVKNDMNVLADFSTINDNVDFAGRIVRNEKGEEVFNFGKHKGKKVTDVFTQEPSYYSWMMNGDFPLYTKKVLTAIRLTMMK